MSRQSLLALFLIALPLLYQLYCPQTQRGGRDGAIVASLSAEWEDIIGEGQHYNSGSPKIAVG